MDPVRKPEWSQGETMTAWTRVGPQGGDKWVDLGCNLERDSVGPELIGGGGERGV